MDLTLLSLRIKVFEFEFFLSLFCCCCLLLLLFVVVLGGGGGMLTYLTEIQW